MQLPALLIAQELLVFLDGKDEMNNNVGERLRHRVVLLLQSTGNYVNTFFPGVRAKRFTPRLSHDLAFSPLIRASNAILQSEIRDAQSGICPRLSHERAFSPPI